MNGQLTTDRNAKIGRAMARYGDYQIVAAVDCTDGDGQRLMVGPGAKPIPLTKTVGESRELGANVLVIASAPIGGRVDAEIRTTVSAALRLGMSVVNPLHARLADEPELTQLVSPGCWIWDVRTEPEDLLPATFQARAVSARRVLTVGTDMAVGKMTTSLEMRDAAQRSGLKARFLATGQTGILVSGDGVAVDSIRVDYAAGAIERLVVRHGYDHEVLFVEGQGSVLHPASCAWLALIRGACPTDLVLVTRPGQHTVTGFDVKIPEIHYVVDLYERICAPVFPARVRAIALNCSDLTHSEARRAIAGTELATGLPVTDVVRFGADDLIQRLYFGTGG